MKLIAETAWHHDGDFSFMKNLVNEICNKTKVDFIKFHITLDVNEYMHHDHSAYKWAVERSLSENQWDLLINNVLKSKKKIMLLYNDKKAVDFGKKYNPELIEIHSVCLNDMKLLNHIKNNIDRNTKIVLGVGGSSLYEIESAIKILNTENIVLMHGFQNYPTKLKDINFNKIKRIMNLFPEFEHGYADHTGWNEKNNILITLFGAALGMHYIEKHITIEYGKERVDWQAAINIDMFNELSEKLAVLEEAKGDGTLALNTGELKYSVFGPMKKAAVLNKNVLKGELLDENVFDFKRTDQISDLSQLDILNSLKKKFTADLKAGHCLQKKDIE